MLEQEDILLIDIVFRFFLLCRISI